MRSALIALPIALPIAPLGAPTVGHADPRPLPFTITFDTAPPGTVELHQVVDLVPLRAVGSAGEQTYLASAVETQLVIGLGDRLELGLALTLVPELGASLAATARFEDAGNGLRQHVRYLLADAGEWPIDVGLVGELTEHDHAIAVEARVILQLGFDRVRVTGNAGVEYAFGFEGQRTLAITPSLGATYELTARLAAGVDAWLRGAYPMDPKPAARTFALGPQLFAGPALLVDLGRVSWTVGAYARVTDLDHEPGPGEPYGRVWFRSIVALEL